METTNPINETNVVSILDGYEEKYNLKGMRETLIKEDWFTGAGNEKNLGFVHNRVAGILWRRAVIEDNPVDIKNAVEVLIEGDYDMRSIYEFLEGHYDYDHDIEQYNK